MVNYHGWIKIAYSTDGENEDKLRGNVINTISSRVREIDADNRILVLKVLNGDFQVTLAGYTNHWSIDVDEAIGLFELIRDLAEGSYGLLYVWNDEDDNYYNQYRVLRLARGELKWFDDPFLSPCNPVIEE
jgi:hypothetical protein